MNTLNNSLRNCLLAPLAGIMAGGLVMLALSPLMNLAMNAYFDLHLFTKCDHPYYYGARLTLSFMAWFAAGSFTAAWAVACTATRNAFFTGFCTVAAVIAGYWIIMAFTSSEPSDKDIREMLMYTLLMLLFAAAGAMAGSVYRQGKRRSNKMYTAV